MFDGHGGKMAADFAKEHFPCVLSQQLTADASDPGGCLSRVFEITDEQFIRANSVRITIQEDSRAFYSKHFTQIPMTRRC